MQSCVTDEVAAEIEFLSLDECLLMDGNVHKMSELHGAHTVVSYSKDLSRTASSQTQPTSGPQ